MSLKRIEKKIEAGRRLSQDDAVRLFKTNDIFTLGRLADSAAHRFSGNRVFFIRNRHINPTNLCINRCRFCAFSRSAKEDGAYEMTLEEILKRAASAGPEVQEFHIVGGLHPEWPFEFYVDMLSELSKRFPLVHIKAFTAVEIDHLSNLSGLGLKKTISVLMDAGLGSMPGGGAEIFSPRIRKKICPEKIPGRRWLTVMRAAHLAGLKTNATMLYGHVEGIEDRVDHLMRLRGLQDETGGFNAFIPLAFQPKNTTMGINDFTSGIDDLKTIAVSRLFLDNFPHIKAYWIMLGEKISQVALAFGADDIDGTVVEEKIAHMAGGTSGGALEKDALVDLIQRTGKIPVERDSLYNTIKEYA